MSAILQRLFGRWQATPPFTPASLSPFIWLTASPTYCFSDTGGTVPCANGDLVAVWKDRSGNARNLAQATSGSRPTLVLDGDGGYHVAFNGTSSTMTCTFGATLGQPNTVAFRADGGRPWENTTGSHRQNLLLQAGFGSSMYAGGNQIGPGPTMPTSGLLRTLTGLFNGASSAMRINGTVDVSGDTGADGIDDLQMASDGAFFFPSQVRHLVAVPGALTGADLANLEAWLTSALS